MFYRIYCLFRFGGQVLLREAERRGDGERELWSGSGGTGLAAVQQAVSSCQRFNLLLPTPVRQDNQSV